jgi:hypothetical protein
MAEMFMPITPHHTIWFGKKKEKYLMLGIITDKSNEGDDPEVLIANTENGDMEVADLAKVRLCVEDIDFGYEEEEIVEPPEKKEEEKVEE